jgi:hypothetical protein
MSAHRSVSVVLCSHLLSLLLLLPSTTYLHAQEEHEEIWQFVKNVTNILEGKPVTDPLSFIASRAKLVRCGEMVPLLPAVSASGGRCPLVDTTYQGVFLEMETNEIEDAGYLLVKTRAADTTKVSFHTVYFAQDSTGHYRIRLWHADPYPSPR